MEIGPEIGDHRYEHWTLAEKYAWMQQGHGPDAAMTARFGVGKLADSLNHSNDALHAELASARMNWQGAASSAATDALACYADGALKGSELGRVGAGTVDTYGGSYATLKKNVPPPVPEGENSIWGKMLDSIGGVGAPMLQAAGVQSDYTKRVMANKAADAAANHAFYAHQAMSQQALSGFPAPDTQPAAQPKAGDGGGPAGAGGGGHLGASAGGGVPGGGSGPGGSAAVPGAGGGGASAGGIAGGAGDGVQGAHRGDTGDTGGGVPGAITPATVIPAGGVPAHPGGSPTSGGGAPSDWVPITPRPGTGPGSYGTGGGWTPRGGAGEPGGLAARGGTPTERAPTAGAYPVGGGGSGGRGPAGTGGMPPMLGAGAGNAQDREHRNTVFIPSDEPFLVEFDDIAPAVIGLPDPDHEQRQ